MKQQLMSLIDMWSKVIYPNLLYLTCLDHCFTLVVGKYIHNLVLNINESECNDKYFFMCYK